MPDTEKRNAIAQWAFDTRPVLLRFHLWLEDVEVDRNQADPVSAHTFTPRGIARCLAMTSAATALGTKLFGQYGEGQGKDKQAYNQVKKAADAISAYVMSRRALAPDPHAAGEPRHHGVPRRRPDAQGRRDARDGRQPAARLRPRLRPPRRRPHRRRSHAEDAQRPEAHLERLLRDAQEGRHHGVGRRGRHAREHQALRRGQGHRPHDGAAPVRLAAHRQPPLRGLHRVPHRAAQGDPGRRPPQRGARLGDAARPLDGADQGRLPGHRAGPRARVDAVGQEPRGAHAPPVGRVDGAGRAPGRGRLEGAVGPAGLHRLRHLRPHLPGRRTGRTRPARRTSSSSTATRPPPRPCRPPASPRCSTSTAPCRCSRPPSS